MLLARMMSVNMNANTKRLSKEQSTFTIVEYMIRHYNLLKNLEATERPQESKETKKTISK